MATLALVFEDQARREAPLRREQQRFASRARSRTGLWCATGLGCVLAALAGAFGASLLDTPELDRFEDALSQGGTSRLERALHELDDAPGLDSARARSARASALAQQAAWGGAPPSAAHSVLARGGDRGPHAPAASALLAALEGEVPESASGSVDTQWATAVAHGWLLSEQMRASEQTLRARTGRPAGASRTLAALQFTLGDVSGSLATLDGVGTSGAREDIAFYEAFTRDDPPEGGTWAVPGRAALLRAWASIRRGDDSAAVAALADARAHMLPWDPVATTTALRLSFLAADASGLRTWSQDERGRWSPSVRALAGAYADAVDGRWQAARRSLEALDVTGPDAPWVAYLLGYGAAEQQRWPDAVRLVSAARRGMSGRGELDVLAAWISTHFLDAGGSHGRLVTLSERSPWAPRVWTARAEAAAASGRPQVEVVASYERALQREHRPAGAAAALAQQAPGEEALHLWTMASELEPSVSSYRVALALAQARSGRLWEASRTFTSVRTADAEAWSIAVELGLALGLARGPQDARLDAWMAHAQDAGVASDRLARLQLRVELQRGHDVSSRARMRMKAGDASAEAAAVAVLALGRAGRVPRARRVAASSRRRLDRAGDAQVSLALAQALHEHGGRGEIREAAQLAFKGWENLPAGDATPPWQTLSYARIAIAIWLDLGNTSGARAIARALTDRLPSSPDAWLLRARVQRAAAQDDFACRSLARARALDPDIVGASGGLDADLTVARCDADPS